MAKSENFKVVEVTKGKYIFFEVHRRVGKTNKFEYWAPAKNKEYADMLCAKAIARDQRGEKF